MGEIFYSLSIVETDAVKVWNSLTKNFPKGHFDGVIEDMYGGKMTSEQEKKIQQDLEDTLKDCHRAVQKNTERLSAIIREKDFQLKHKVEDMARMTDLHQHNLKILTEDLRMQFELKLRDLEKLMNGQFIKEIQNFREKEELSRREKVRMKNEINLLQK